MNIEKQINEKLEDKISEELSSAVMKHDTKIKSIVQNAVDDFIDNKFQQMAEKRISIVFKRVINSYETIEALQDYVMNDVVETFKSNLKIKLKEMKK